MDGWIVGLMDGLVDGWMDGWTVSYTHISSQVTRVEFVGRHVCYKIIYCLPSQVSLNLSLLSPKEEGQELSLILNLSFFYVFCYISTCILIRNSQRSRATSFLEQLDSQLGVL